MKKTKMIFAILMVCFLSTTLTSSSLNATNFKVPLTDYYTGEPDEQPTFKGGQTAMWQFFIDNVKYPEKARKKGVSGTVYISCVITKEGKVTKAKVKKGVDALLDKEAVRVVKGMPDWNPGKKDGKDIDVEIVIPISFKLDDSKK